MSFQAYSESIRSRLRLGEINPKLAIGITFIVVAIVFGIIFSIASVTSFGQESADTDLDQSFSITTKDGQASSESSDTKKQICVYVSGCVVNPGICYLEEGSRVADAIGAVGGMSSDAASDSLNLARLLEDGEQINVISLAERDEMLKMTESDASSNPNGSGPNPSKPQAGSAVNNTSATIKNGKVNINTATSTELQTIKGIGQSKAEKIIAYRESNGVFKSIDDLKKVSGIGEKTLESIRDAICV